VDSAGNLYIADSYNNRIRKVTNGVITTVAGNGTQGYSGDNGPATSAQFSYPEGVTVDSAGNLYIADTGNGRIRKVSNGVITTVAGNGTGGFSGDGGPATSAELYCPVGVAMDSAGNLYIADACTQRIRKVANGVITTVAGNGTGYYSGDNGPAASAELNGPSGLAPDAAGNLYIADSFNNRIRKVTNGVITTVAGNGTQGFSGDNGPAANAMLSGPIGITVDSAGDLYIADTGNSRIRILTPTGSPCTHSVSPTTLQAPAAGGNLTVSIQTTASCSWTVSGLPGWITVSGASSGVGSAAVTLVVSPNSGAARSATISIVGVSVTVTQSAGATAPCAYSVSPTTSQAPASGGSLTVSIQTGASCPWAVSGLPGWITVSGASSGAGAGSVSLVVAPNSGSALSATILIAGLSVTITQPAAAAPLPTIKGVTNAASYATGAVSPGELVTLFGTAIGPTTAAYATTDPATGKLATTIGGVQALFNGTPAPMIYASSTQVSAVVPYEMAPVVSPSVWIKYLGQTSNVLQLTSVTTAPGLFTQNASGSGPGAILNQDNSVNGPGNGAAKGSIVQVYMTGEGQTRPLGVTGAITTPNLPPPQVTPAPVLAVGVTINGQPALYVYAGEAPGLVAGMMQLNVQIPANAPSGDLPILVSVGGHTSQNAVTVSVQ
jgi:uncharacterized protein (TIGR03437 family)